MLGKQIINIALWTKLLSFRIELGNFLTLYAENIFCSVLQSSMHVTYE